MVSKETTNQGGVLGMKKMIPFFLILALLFAGCSADPTSQSVYQPPEKFDDGIDVGTLEEVNIDSNLIQNAVDKIRDGKYSEVHSILIFTDNKLVFEEYFAGHPYQWDGPGNHGAWVEWDRTMPHETMSDTKSITSASIGIAIDQGFIDSVDQSIFDYLPEYQYFNTGGKDKITIKHLLTMTSGLDWNEWGAPYTDLNNDIFRLWVECENQAVCTLERPLIAEPGTSFNYCGGGMVLLTEIIENATGMDIETFSGQYLFEPLGIDPPVWARFESGLIDGSNGINITPREMAKIGLTFLNDGVWDGEQIVSEQWVEKSAAAYAENSGIKVPGEGSGRVGYAYSWWTKQYSHSGQEINMFYADGWGGQLIMVLPELNTVVVFTGGNYVTKNPVFKIFEKYILPAIK